MHAAQYQLRLLIDALSTPIGILAIAALLLLLVLTLLIPRIKWFVLSAGLFASTLVVADIVGRKRLLSFLEALSRQGRALTISMFLIALVGFLTAPGGRRRKPFVLGFLFFFIFQLIVGFNLTLRSEFGHGAGGIVLFMLQFFLFGLAIPNALESDGDMLKYIRGVAGFGVIFAGMNLLQLLVNPYAVVATRFAGTTANQQGTGCFSAMGLLPVCYMLARPGRERIGRIVYGVSAAMLTIITLWSGSRTGAILAIAGLAVMFRKRLSRLVATAAVIALFMLIASVWLFPTAQYISPHLFSTVDTRSGVWSGLIHQFLDHPMIGLIGPDQNGYGENSYLSVAASYGIIGLVPFCLALFFIANALRKLIKSRQMVHDTLLADLVIAAFAQWALGGIFEAYMLGILNTAQILNFCFFPILAYLLEQAEQAPAMLDGDAFSVEPDYILESAQLPAGI